VCACSHVVCEVIIKARDARFLVQTSVSPVKAGFAALVIISLTVAVTSAQTASGDPPDKPKGKALC
jgi:hypothetical protein